MVALGLGVAAAVAEESVAEPGSGRKPDTLSLEQVVKLSNTITNENAAPLSNVNFPVSIDSVVPGQISLRPLPSSANAAAPQFTGDSYIVVEELIAIVEPKTRKIVAVVPRARSQ
jgi:hypothetical protein